MNFDLCDHWVIYDPLRSEKTVIAVDRIKTVLSYILIDKSFQEISEKSVEPVLMVVKGLNEIHQFSRGKNWRGSKNHVLHLGPPSKRFWQIWSTNGAQCNFKIKGKVCYLIYFITFLLKYDPKVLLYENLLHTPHMAKFLVNTQACIANER